MKKVNIFIVLAVLLALGTTSVYAIPVLPHAFYGSVTINENPASVGTSVEARGPGVITGVEGNPLTVTQAGKYGGPGGLEPKLVVQGDIPNGATITFYVNGVSTGETYPFDSGETTELYLSVTIATRPPPTGGGAGAPTYYLETNLFGIERRFLISGEGEILKTIEAISEDGMLTITIPKGTIALGKDGKRLKWLEAAVDESPPDPPEGANVIGLAYDFGSDGATFEPPITFTWSYDPDALPEGVAEEDLVIECYVGEWEECISTVNLATHTVTASVDHFTSFAMIAFIPPPAPAPPAPTPPPPTPPPPTLAPTPAPAPALPPVAALPPTPPPAPPVPPAPPPAPPLPEPTTNWLLLGGIVAAIVVLGLLIFFLVVRPRAY